MLNMATQGMMPTLRGRPSIIQTSLNPNDPIIIDPIIIDPIIIDPIRLNNF